MGLNRLRTTEMVTITAPLVDVDHPDHQALAGEPALAPLLPEIEAAHQGLHATHFVGPGPVRLKQLQEKQKTLDVLHDDVVRGIWYFLTALLFFQKDPDKRRALEQLQALLLPEGLSAVQRSYREEAGQAALTASRLGDGERKTLKAMKLPDGGNLLDKVEEWLALGSQLGALDRERAGEVSDERPTAGDALAARNRWVRVIQAMRSVADLTASDSPDIQELLDRVSAAERYADRRAAEPGDPEDGELEPGDPVPAQPPADGPVEAPATEAN